MCILLQSQIFTLAKNPRSLTVHFWNFHRENFLLNNSSIWIIKSDTFRRWISMNMWNLLQLEGTVEVSALLSTIPACSRIENDCLLGKTPGFKERENGCADGDKIIFYSCAVAAADLTDNRVTAADTEQIMKVNSDHNWGQTHKYPLPLRGEKVRLCPVVGLWRATLSCVSGVFVCDISCSASSWSAAAAVSVSYVYWMC